MASDADVVVVGGGVVGLASAAALARSGRDVLLLERRAGIGQEVSSEWLVPDQAGVRPKLAGPGEPFRDFVVEEESAAGFPGFVNCIGIESPGLTAAPAIAERVVELLR